MRQLFLEKGALALKEVCEPSLDDFSVLVSVSYSYMSVGQGLTSLIDTQYDIDARHIPTKVKKIIELASQRRFGYNHTAEDRTIAFGHSCAGVVLAVGKQVKNVRAGDMVACAGPGLAYHADVVCVPEHLVVRVKEQHSLKQASLIGLGALALQSIRRAALELGEHVAVLGLDSFGHVAMRLAAMNGAHVAGLDSNTEHIAYCQSKNMHSVYSLDKDNIEQSVRSIVGPHGFDCIIISPDYVQQKTIERALSFIRKKGRIVIAGNQAVNLPYVQAHQKEVDIRFSLSYGPGRHDPLYEQKNIDYPYAYVRWTEQRNMELCMELVEQKRLNLDDLIAHEVSLDTVSSVLQDLQKKRLVGVLVDFTANKRIKSQQTKDIQIIPAQVIPRYDEYTVAVVGFGSFARSVIIPILKTLPSFELTTILDEDATTVMRARKLLKQKTVCVGNVSSVLRSKAHIIFISPSVSITVDEIIECLEAGRVLFIAHPLTFSAAELDRLEAYLERNKHAKLCVGFFRSYAACVKKIRQELAHRHSPLMINYRLNVGRLEDEEKIHAQWRAGKAVIESSYIFDLFLSLTGAKPVSLSVESLRSSTVYPTDNLSLQLALSDGSLCSLMLTCLGSAAAGTERMEIFADSKTIVMEDYQTVKGFGDDIVLNEKLNAADKGYVELIEKFLQSIKMDAAPVVSYAHIIQVARLAHLTDSMIVAGGSYVIGKDNQQILL